MNIPIPEDLKTKCPLCQGVGHKERVSFADSSQMREASCRHCHGAGWIWALDQERMAARIAVLTAERNDFQSRLLAAIEAALILTDRRDAFKKRTERLEQSLSMLYARWENGTPCTEANEDGDCTDGSPIGNALKLSFAEEQEILNLVLCKAEEGEQACANCGSPYRAHLLHDGARCSPEGVAKWFPQSLADALTAARRLSGALSKP